MKRCLYCSLFCFLCAAFLVGCATGRTLENVFDIPVERISTSSLEDPIRVRFISFREDDEHGIVAVEGSFKNQSGKTIKDVRFTLRPYDKYGNQVYCREKHWSAVTLEEEGPWVPGGVSYQYWPKVWYSFSIAEIALEKIEIDFLDGTSLTLPSLTPDLNTE